MTKNLHKFWKKNDNLYFSVCWETVVFSQKKENKVPRSVIIMVLFLFEGQGGCREIPGIPLELQEEKLP